MEEKRVALVTGGMGGLGTALCRRLHDAGFAVALTYSPGNPAPQAGSPPSATTITTLPLINST